MRFFCSARERFWFKVPVSTISVTEAGTISEILFSCGMYPSVLAATLMVPDFGFTNPRIVLSRVDLPEPFGPTTQRKSPLVSSNDRLLIIVVLSYSTVSCLIDKILFTDSP